MSISPHLERPFVLLLALALLLAACGSSDAVDDVDAGGNDESSESPAEGDAGSDGDEGSTPQDGDGDSAADGVYQVTTAQPDMISGQPATIAEIRTVDDQTIGVRYQNGSEPCSLANVTVTESETEIVVALETGLHPNAAAMSCIAQVIDYEIQVPLGAPIGDRQIVPAEA